MKKVRVFIGRMSPLHIGHCATIEKAAEGADVLIVIIGSAYRSRNLKNPFTYDDRRKILESWIAQNPDLAKKIVIRPMEDQSDNVSWLAKVQAIVHQFTSNAQLDGLKSEIEIVCSSKEDWTSYPFWFKNWKSVVVPAMMNGEEYLSATYIRDIYFNINASDEDAHRFLPDTTIEFLTQFRETEEWKNLQQEYEFIKSYKKSWEPAPFPPIFVTTDAVMVQSGHLLVIKRKGNPGKGMIALPGGFLNINERILDGCIRELREETGLKVPDKVLRGSIAGYEIIDDPDRSERGRTITNAYFFKLADHIDLPHVRGDDDAEKAWWMPLQEVYENRDQFYEDHFLIISKFINF